MIYSQIISSKTNSLVPIFISGKPSSSKYNPEKEAFLFAGNIKEADFFIISGLCGGFHIKELSNKFPHAKILVIENDEESIDFLKNNCSLVKKLLENKNIIPATISSIKNTILQYYLPVLYNSLSVIEYRPWT